MTGLRPTGAAAAAAAAAAAVQLLVWRPDVRTA
jgi:cobalamin biosynthesis protein CbiD